MALQALHGCFWYGVFGLLQYSLRNLERTSLAMRLIWVSINILHIDLCSPTSPITMNHGQYSTATPFMD